MLVEKNGKKVEVTEKAFEVVYKGLGFKEYVERNYFELDIQELESIKVSDLKAFLDEQEITYTNDDKKADLIALIIGEEDTDTQVGDDDAAQ